MQVPAQDPAGAAYWDYYQSWVEPVIRRHLFNTFPESRQAAVHLTIRLSSDARFKPSELTYWMLRDLCASSVNQLRNEDEIASGWMPSSDDAEFVPSILAAVELSMMGRLVRDDILDNHSLRQNFRALHAEVGRPSAWLVGNGLQDAANELLLSLDLKPPTILALQRASLDYSQRLLDSSLFELRFSPANLESVRRLNYGTYYEHMRKKHGIGQLSGDLCFALSSQFADSRPSFARYSANHAAIMKKLADYDVAGGVDNDWSEFSGRRGGDWERIVQKRGRRNEVELGRPTVWNLFLQDARSIDRAIAQEIVFSEDLTELNSQRDDPRVTKLVGELVEHLLEELLAGLQDIEAALPLTAAHLRRLRERKIGLPKADALVEQELGEVDGIAPDSPPTMQVGDS